MTAPLSDDEIQAALAEGLETALGRAYDYSSYRWPQQDDCTRIAADLLPVVRDIAAREAARELRAAAALRALALGLDPTHGKATT
jgi:hypothetical protein